MKLSLRFLNDLANVNSFEQTDSIEFSAGDDQLVSFQLVDGSLDKSEQGFNPPGRRYCPPATTTLSVTLVNVDDAKVVTRQATQLFPTIDASMWQIPILKTDPLSGTVSMTFTLTEPTRVLNGRFVPGILLRVR